MVDEGIEIGVDTFAHITRVFLFVIIFSESYSVGCYTALIIVENAEVAHIRAEKQKIAV